MVPGPAGAPYVISQLCPSWAAFLSPGRTGTLPRTENQLCSKDPPQDAHSLRGAQEMEAAMPAGVHKDSAKSPSNGHPHQGGHTNLRPERLGDGSLG